MTDSSQEMPSSLLSSSAAVTATLTKQTDNSKEQKEPSGASQGPMKKELPEPFVAPKAEAMDRADKELPAASTTAPVCPVSTSAAPRKDPPSEHDMTITKPKEAPPTQDETEPVVSLKEPPPPTETKKVAATEKTEPGSDSHPAQNLKPPPSEPPQDSNPVTNLKPAPPLATTKSPPVASAKLPPPPPSPELASSKPEEVKPIEPAPAVTVTKPAGLKDPDVYKTPDSERDLCKPDHVGRPALPFMSRAGSVGSGVRSQSPMRSMSPMRATATIDMPMAQEPELEGPVMDIIQPAGSGNLSMRSISKRNAAAIVDMPTMEEPTMVEPSAATTVVVAPAAVLPRPGAVAVAAAHPTNSRLARKMRAGATSMASVSTLPTPEDDQSSNSMLNRKLRASVNTMSAAVSSTAVGAGPRPGAQAVKSDSRVQRKIRASLGGGGGGGAKAASAAAAVASSIGVSDQSQSTLSNSANLATVPAIQEPGAVASATDETILPGTVTSVRASSARESRIQRKIRNNMSSMSQPSGAGDGETPSGMGSATRTAVQVGSAAMADIANEESNGPEPSMPRPGTVNMVSSAGGDSRVARKIASSLVGAKAATDDSKTGRKSRRNQGKKDQGTKGDTGEDDNGKDDDDDDGAAKVGAVSTKGDDPAAAKNWVNDDVFRREDGTDRHYDPDDYLRMQVRATQEAQREKAKKKKPKDEGDPASHSMKDGAKLVPSMPGAYAVKQSRGWFTGGFRQRSRSAAGFAGRRSRSANVIDTNVEAAKPDEVDEEDEFCGGCADRPTLCVGMVLLLFCILAIAIPTGLFVNRDPDPTMAPSRMRDPLMDDFRELFFNVSGPVIDDITSPQAKAMDFLLFDDDLRLGMNSVQLVQRYILMTFYFETGMDKTVNSKWATGVSECEWNYIRCTDNNTVRSIEVSALSLTGTLLPELQELTDMSLLDISSNNGLSHDDFPHLLYNLTNLRYLYAEGNFWRGQLGSEIGQLSDLVHLSLGNNNLEGSLPAEIGLLTNLERFEVPLNRMVGDPFAIPFPSTLRRLDLGSNGFTGTIPTDLATLSDLQWLLLSSNGFTGTLPSTLGQLTKIGEWLFVLLLVRGVFGQSFFPSFIRLFQQSLRNKPDTSNTDTVHSLSFGSFPTKTMVSQCGLHSPPWLLPKAVDSSTRHQSGQISVSVLSSFVSYCGTASVHSRLSKRHIHVDKAHSPSSHVQSQSVPRFSVLFEQQQQHQQSFSTCPDQD